ncbi:MAG TPA: hypothetical protein DF383_13690 [Deltaproteobacteria bacterium]|nr:hypothetical protein [Deltaproteobacteria bacterium]
MRHLFTLILLFFFSVSASAAELSGVTMSETMAVGGKTLVLNGMGLRKKAIIKVYVAGLYLPAKESSAERILGSNTERGMVMEFVRGVDKEKICNAWHEGLEKNSPDKAVQLKGQFDVLCTYMEEMEDGSKLTFAYIPGQGTTVSLDGAVKGSIAGKDFADALFACWIGPKPPGEDFKAGLLGS